MPIRKLAALLDIDQRTLSKLERGKRPVNVENQMVGAKFRKNGHMVNKEYKKNKLCHYLHKQPYTPRKSTGVRTYFCYTPSRCV